MAAKRKFRANWRVVGVAKKPLTEGDIVMLTDEDAALLVKHGALSPVGGELAFPEPTPKPAPETAPESAQEPEPEPEPAPEETPESAAAGEGADDSASE